MRAASLLTMTGNPARHRADLEQTEQHVDQDHDPERDHRIQPGRQTLHCPHDPTHVEVLGPQAGNGDPMRLQPGSRLFIESLKPRCVRDEGSADPTEAPGHGGREHDEDQHDQRYDDGERQKLRQTCLKPVLERPDDGDDEDGTGNGRKDRVREIERSQQQNCADDAQQHRRSGGEFMSRLPLGDEY